MGTLTRGAADPGGGLAGVRLPSAPLFGREGLVDIVLSEALAPVLRDLASSGALLPDIRDEQWSGFDGQVTAMLYGPDDSGQGVFVMAGSRCRRESRRSRARSRKWAIEARWHADKSASWPECPEHPALSSARAGTVRGPPSVDLPQDWAPHLRCRPAAQLRHLAPGAGDGQLR